MMRVKLVNFDICHEYKATELAAGEFGTQAGNTAFLSTTMQKLLHVKLYFSPDACSTNSTAVLNVKICILL